MTKKKEIKNDMDKLSPKTPGSKRAVEAGCTCAVIDNHYGRGVPTKDGPEFWITQGCPLHDQSHD